MVNNCDHLNEQDSGKMKPFPEQPCFKTLKML